LLCGFVAVLLAEALGVVMPFLAVLARFAEGGALAASLASRCAGGVEGVGSRKITRHTTAAIDRSNARGMSRLRPLSGNTMVAAVPTKLELLPPFSSVPIG